MSDVLRIAELERRVAELTLDNRRLVAKLEAHEGLSGADERVRWEREEARPERHWHQRMGIFEHAVIDPLNALGTMIRALHEDDVTRPPDTEALDMTEHLLGRISQAVDDLIWIHRIDFGLVCLQDWRLQRRQIGEVLMDAVQRGRRFFRAPERPIDVDLPTSPMWVHGDPSLLARMFVNLLFDASKRTSLGHRIRLRAELDGDEVVVCVTDDGWAPHGSGIDPFVVDNGLFLARELAELHSGRIEARRDDEQQHNAFVVHLPLAPARHEPSIKSSAG